MFSYFIGQLYVQIRLFNKKCKELFHINLAHFTYFNYEIIQQQLSIVQFLQLFLYSHQHFL